MGIAMERQRGHRRHCGDRRGDCFGESVQETRAWCSILTRNTMEDNFFETDCVYARVLTLIGCVRESVFVCVNA